VLILCGLFLGDAFAQDMEPRRWTHLPTGVNVLGTALGATDGEISFDPVLRIENATFELYSLGARYVHSFEWLGMASRFDVLVPYGHGRWEGLLDGAYDSVRREGFFDPTVRLSMNLYGAPPLKPGEFAGYYAQRPVTTTIGAAFALKLPVGEYYPGRLINLGNNRYVIQPQLGVLHQRGPWQFELTTSVSFFEDNPDFYAGAYLEQDPMWFVQGHIVRSFERGMWGSFGAGHTYGGRWTIDGVPKEKEERSRFIALSFGVPLNRQHTITVSYVYADTNILLGLSTNSVVLGWSMNWAK